jgi:hypothetical protein
MKTAGRENPNHGVAVPRNRAHGAVGQNRSCSIKWAAKQEKVRPWEGCFFLTSTFIELLRSDRNLKGVARFKQAALATPQNEIRDGSVEDDAANEDDDKTSVLQGPWKHINHTC